MGSEMCIRDSIESIMEACPKMRPLCTASYVFFPITDFGFTSSTDLSDEVFDVNASRDILIPGAIDPPKYSLLSLTTSKVVAVPKSTIITDF